MSGKIEEIEEIEALILSKCPELAQEPDLLREIAEDIQAAPFELPIDPKVLAQTVSNQHDKIALEALSAT